MQYAPSTTDRSGEILSNASQNASAIQLQGMQSFANSMGNAMESMGKGYAKANENKMTSDYLDSMANYYSKITDSDGKPLISQETLETFSKGSLGKKQGIITPVQAKYDQMLQNSYIDRQMAAYLERSNQTATNANKVPPNQQPISTGIGASANNTAPQQQSFFRNPNIQTQDQFGRTNGN